MHQKKASAIILMLTLIFAHTATAFTIEEATIASIHESFKQHQITCQQLVNAYLERIKRYNLSVDKKAPINAFTEINPSVLSDAQTIDKDYAQSGKLKGPLHCIPVILKDNIDSYDTTTTAGSYALLGNQPIKDADITSRLRNAGAIILGKGGMDEFAWGMFGLSSRSGRIGNVYDTSKNPGGSSGGSAAAVSANFAAIGIGTDNSGSVRIPAVYNGIVGLRPTAGLISQQGVFPMGNIDGTAGPLARTTSDLAIMMDVLATSQNPSKKPYVSYLTKNGLEAKRIGIVRLVGKVDPYKNISNDIQILIDQAVNTMQQQGATFIDISLPDFNNSREDNQSGEIEDINHYLSSFPATRKNFKDICESDRTRNFGDVKSCLKFMKSVASKESQQYKNALHTINKNKKYVTNILKTNKLDALLLPLSTQASGSYDGNTVNVWQAAISSNAGLPAIDFIVGYNENMPVGIDMVGADFSEGALIAIAFAYENATHLRHAPTMPDPNIKLESLSIPQMNNLFSLIGKTTYDKVLKNAKPGADLKVELSPEIFRNIVSDVINSDYQI